MRFQIVLTMEVVRMLEGIQDSRIRSQLIGRIDRLKEDPDKQGKALTGDLSGYRSIRVAGQRYRIIYSVEKDQVQVVVIAAGIRREGDRRDIYRLAQRLVRLGLVEPPDTGVNSGDFS